MFWVEELRHDVALALRSLRKNRGFAAIAILTMALGIGINSAIFSVVHAVVLRPLPYPDPDRLVSLWETVVREAPRQFSSGGNYLGGAVDSGRTTVSPANLIDYQERNHVFSGIAGFTLIGSNWTGVDVPERLSGEQVTANYFDVVGVQPARGRAFAAQDDRNGSPHVLILTDHFWRSRFGADPQVIGRSLTLDGDSFQVVGIMPPGFEPLSQLGFPGRVEFLVPAAYSPSLLSRRGDHAVNAVARLRPGVTLAQAQGEMDAISHGLERVYPDTNHNVRAVVAILQKDLVRNVRISLFILLAAVGLILLIACANLANLLLARANQCRQEIAVRYALGANRFRIIRQVLAQSLVLSVLGCALGLLLEAWTHGYLIRIAPATIPRVADAGIGVPVLAFAILLTLLTGILFGLAPAWLVSQPEPSRALKSASRQIRGGGVLQWQSALMLAQVASSMVLLIGAGLLIKSFISLNRVNLGFRTDHVLAMNVNLPKARYTTPASRLAFFEDLAARVEALPGVESVAFANRMPMRGGWGGNVYLDSQTGRSSTDDVDLQAVSPGYFQTLGISLLRGRLLGEQDRAGTPRAAVVNAAFARRYFGESEVIGRRIRKSLDTPWIIVVGVVEDIHRGGRDAPITPQVYFAAAQTDLYPVALADFAFRAAGDPKNLAAAVQRQVWEIDKDQPVTGVKTLDEVIWDSQSQRRFQTLLLSLFAGLAAVLAALGIYGVIAYVVSQRTPEIGIRLALGAARRDILRLVMTRVAIVVGAGIVAGAAGSYLVSRSLQVLLFATAPTDPLTYLAVALLFGGIAVAACCLPALQATRIDPLTALRYE